MDQQQTGDAGSANTGTRDSTYNLVAVLYHALQGVENTGIYLQDAPEGEQRQFLQMAHDQQRKLADEGKRLLHDALMREITGEGGGQGGGLPSDVSGADVQRMGSAQSHGFKEAQGDDPAFRFASSQTEGGASQFEPGQPTGGDGGKRF